MLSETHKPVGAAAWALASENRSKVYLLAWVPLASAYLLILALFMGVDGFTLVSTVAANIAVPIVLGTGVCWMITKVAVHTPLRTQLLIHTLGSVVFSLLWALGAFRLLQLTSGLLEGDWSPTSWPSAALAWQLFLGISIYFTIASGTYAYWALNKLSERQETAPEKADVPSETRVFAKTSDGFRPIDISDIAAARIIDGATSLFTAKDRLECRLSLSDLEKRLPADKFLRIHRSALISVDHIHSIEPAGNGRMTVHLNDGTSLETSRSGTALLKDALAVV